MSRSCLFWSLFLSSTFVTSCLSGPHQETSGVPEKSGPIKVSIASVKHAKVDASSPFLHTYRRQLRQEPPVEGRTITKEGDAYVHLKQTSVRVEFTVESFTSKRHGPLQCVLSRNSVAEWRDDNCSSPLKLENQVRRDGTYRLEIFNERKASRNDISASKSWIIDRTPPQTKIARVIEIGHADRRFTFIAKDTWSVDNFQCRLDRKAWFTCQSPYAFTRAGPGTHTFEVRAIDRAGNRDKSPEVYSWTSPLIENLDMGDDLEEGGDLLAPSVGWSDEDVRSGSNHASVSSSSSSGGVNGATFSFFFLIGIVIYIVIIVAFICIGFYSGVVVVGSVYVIYHSARTTLCRLFRVRQEASSSGSIGWRDSAKKIMLSVQRSARRLRH